MWALWANGSIFTTISKMYQFTKDFSHCEGKQFCTFSFPVQRGQRQLWRQFWQKQQKRKFKIRWIHAFSEDMEISPFLAVLFKTGTAMSILGSWIPAVRAREKYSYLCKQVPLPINQKAAPWGYYLVFSNHRNHYEQTKSQFFPNNKLEILLRRSSVVFRLLLMLFCVWKVSVFPEEGNQLSLNNFCQSASVSSAKWNARLKWN